MEVVISYDVDKKRHKEVKQALLNEKFQDFFTKGNRTYNMPNTTLWHPNLPDAFHAKAVFQDVINELNKSQPPDKIIRIERFMAFGIATASGIEGDEHSE